MGWWFVSVVDGRERAFLQLRNALRACEASLGENHSSIESGLACLGKEGAPGDLSEDEDWFLYERRGVQVPRNVVRLRVEEGARALRDSACMFLDELKVVELAKSV